MSKLITNPTLHTPSTPPVNARATAFTTSSSTSWSTLRAMTLSALVSTLAVPTLVRADEDMRPMSGDPKNGEKLFKKAAKKPAKLDGKWLNARSDANLVSALKAGKDGLPRIDSENILDLYDVVAYMRATRSDVRDLAGDATHALLAEGTYDKYALERLKERAGIVPDAKSQTIRVFALYGLEESSGEELTLVDVKDNKKRDKLKPSSKVGYVVFMPLADVRGGGHELAVGVDKDIVITSIEVRGPDGERVDDLNQVAARVIGKGARGKYDTLKLVGAGKAVRDLEKPLSDAFLLGMEGVYMYEVTERDYFAFDD